MLWCKCITAGHGPKTLKVSNVEGGTLTHETKKLKTFQMELS